MMFIVIGIMIALSFAWYFRQKQRHALQDQQERLRRKQEDLLHLLRMRKEIEERKAAEDSGEDQPS